MPRTIKQNSSNNPKKVKSIQKQSKNEKKAYSQHQYIEPDALDEEELIEEQAELLNKLDKIHQDTIQTDIKLVSIKQAKNDLTAYHYQPIYLVKHEGDTEDDLHIVLDWDLSQTSIKSFSKEDQSYFKQQYRDGKMLSPKVKVFLTHKQIQILQRSLQSSLTDGIIEYLRMNFIKGNTPKVLSEEQQKVFSRFVKYPADYKIIILDHNFPIEAEAFRQAHLLAQDTKIRITQKSETFCEILIEVHSYVTYNVLQKYFIQNNFNLLHEQRYNKTSEIIKILFKLYEATKETKQADHSANFMDVEKLDSKRELSQTTAREDQIENRFQIKLDFMKPGYSSPEKSIQKKQNQVSSTTDFSNQDKEETQKLNIKENFNNHSTASEINQDFDISNGQSLEAEKLQMKSKSAENQVFNEDNEKNKNKKLSIEKITKRYISMHQILKNLEKIFEMDPNIKQQFQTSKNSYLLKDTLDKYKKACEACSKFISGCEDLPAEILNFMLEFKDSSVSKIINNILRNKNKKDQIL